MKTTNCLQIVAFAATLFLSACATSNVASIQNEIEPKDIANNMLCSVTYKTGITKNYTNLKLVTAVLTTPYLLADGHIKIKGADVASYYNGKYDAIAQESFYTKEISKVAKKVLPGFAIKEISGTFNLYSIEFYKNGNIVKKYFLQEGEQGKIELFDAALLNKYEGKNFENKLSKKNSKAISNKTMIALVDRLNNSLSISKN